MTTATKTSPKKTKTTKTKKPKWTVVSFAKIEKWRVKLGLSKSAMGEALGVTNSTFHNWRRGTTVPHANQQEEILVRLNALEKNAGSSSNQGTGASSGEVGEVGKGSSTRKGDRSGSTGGKGRSGGRGRGRAGAAISHQDIGSPGTPSASTKVPRDDIAAITVAFIQSQKKAVSSDNVIKFVEQLQAVL